MSVKLFFVINPLTSFFFIAFLITKKGFTDIGNKKSYDQANLEYIQKFGKKR